MTSHAVISSHATARQLSRNSCSRLRVENEIFRDILKNVAIQYNTNLLGVVYFKLSNVVDTQTIKIFYVLLLEE